LKHFLRGDCLGNRPDLQSDASISHGAPKPYPDSFIIGILSDAPTHDAGFVEGKAIIRIEILSADCPYNGLDVLDAVFHPAEKIDVHRRTGNGGLPRDEHQGALENELSFERSDREPVKKAFHGVILEKFSERPLRIPGDVEKALADGGRNVFDDAVLQKMASR
jgi:hypothetical protein